LTQTPIDKMELQSFFLLIIIQKTWSFN